MVAQEYEIRVEVSSDVDWHPRFEEVSVIPAGNAEFILKGVIQDEPALHGLLGKIRSAGLVLKSVELKPVS